MRSARKHCKTSVSVAAYLVGSRRYKENIARTCRPSDTPLTQPRSLAVLNRATHFVRFPDAHGSTYWSAVRAFGPPAFLHRYWDQRAFREIADGDLVVFAKGDADQSVVPWNGDDEFYADPLPRLPSPAAGGGV